MSTHRVLSITGDIALQLLRLTKASADAFPPLKSVAGGALHIFELVDKFHSNTEYWQELGIYVADVTASVVHSLTQADGSHEMTKRNLMTLKAALDEVEGEIEKEQAASWYRRAGRFLKDPEKTMDLRRRLDDVVGLFQLSVVTAQTINVENILAAVVTNTMTLSAMADNTAVVVAQNEGLMRKASKQGIATALGKLTHVQGASWDSARGCMPDTRAALLNRIEEWIDVSSGSNDPNIMLLTAVAGAGKTTLAHTVAERCAKTGKLGSSFFFDRDTADRDNPNAVFASIVADLGGRNSALGNFIARAIEADPSLPSAPITRQFESLMLHPCQTVTVTGPTVIVIDGLDEAWNEDFLDILCERAPLLPRAFRLFVTCRMRPELERLRNATHVEWAELDINGEANVRDVAIYARSRLGRLAKGRKELGEDWPGDELRRRFIERAGGLFLWVDVVCGYLQGRSNLPGELSKLMAAAGTITSTAEARMDKLYATILESFDWTDDDFVADYQRVVGTAIASREPLSMAAMQELYGKSAASEYTLQRLGSLLTGVTRKGTGTEPVRVLHQSLRDFLVDRAYPSKDWGRFCINVEEHSQTLCLLSLRLVNRGLCNGMPGTGYLATDRNVTPGVPRIPKKLIPEGLLYACFFWLDHLNDTSLDDGVVAELIRLKKSKVVLWLELTASFSHCRRLKSVLEKTQVEQDLSGEGEHINEDKTYASACDSLSGRLVYEGRREEALEMAEEAVETRQRLVARQPTTSTPALAVSLSNLSNCLSRVGRRKDALVAIEQAVELHQQLGAERPVVFTPALAMSLNNLSLRLSDVGRHSDALAAIERAAEIYRQLAAEQPTVFTPEFAGSLNILSLCLSEMGRSEDALLVIEKAVELYRQIVAERPVVFTSDLAMSLNNLSLRLSDVGRRGDALMAIEQAVEAYQQLAVERPAAFIPVLSGSLHNLSIGLSDMRRHEDALVAAEQAVRLYRQLAAERPSVFIRNLCRSLGTLCNCLTVVGRPEDALIAAEQAVELHQQLAAEQPAEFAPVLAMSLENLSHRLHDVGRREDALVAIEQAVGICRQLAVERPTEFIPVLTRFLDELSSRTSSVGRYEDGLADVEQSTALHRQLIADPPATTTSGFAQSLAQSIHCQNQLRCKKEVYGSNLWQGAVDSEPRFVSYEDAKETSPPPQPGSVQVKAVQDYNLNGNLKDDISFRTGDVITVIEESNLCWWAGKLNDTPSHTPSYMLKPGPTQVKALHDYNSDGDSICDLSFRSGDIITVVEERYPYWWVGRLNRKEGFFPINYVEKIPNPPSDPS